MSKILKLLKNKNILIVSHDIGGANNIKSFFDHYKIKAKFYLRGPALKIFKKKKNNNFLKKIKESDVVITGTGWKTNLEYNAIKAAKKYDKFCITFLDHWVNYKKRFLRKNKLALPDKILVFDKESQSNIKKIFRNQVDTIKITNYYFKNFTKKLKKRKKNSNVILYLASNYDKALKKKIDIILLKKFLKKILLLKKYEKFSIDIKPHPTENFRKYISLKKKYKKINKIIVNKKLEDILLGYKIAAGTETSGLILSKICKLDTINNVKGTGIKKSLPKKYITMYI